MFTVSLSEAAASQVTVDFSTLPGTAGSSDYTAVQNQTLTFAPGETQKSITVATSNDDQVEAPESFSVLLSSPVGASISTISANATINDNDSPLQFISSDVLARDVRPGQTIEVPVVYNTKGVSGEAVAIPATLISFNLHFDADALTFVETRLDQTFFTEGIAVVPRESRPETDAAVSGDDADSATESVLVTSYSDHDSALILGWPNSPTTDGTTLFIARFTVNSGFTDSTSINFTANATGNAVGASQPFSFASNSLTLNPAPPAQVSISDALPVTEGGSAVFTVTLSEPSASEVTVNYSTSDGQNAGATGGQDFTHVAETLTFAPGETEKTITVVTSQDSDVEPTESFSVVLASPSGATIDDGTGIGTINSPGNVDANGTFDASDTFLILLVGLSGTDEQIELAKGPSPLTAAQIRAAITQLGSLADIDGDGDYDASDSFLVHLINLSGTDQQIQDAKGASPLTVAQIRANVERLAGSPSQTSAGSSQVLQSVQGSTAERDLFNSSESDRQVVSEPGSDEPSNDVVWKDFRDWIDSV